VVIPVAGDWDGDGKWSVGIYDPTNGMWFLKNAVMAGAPDYAFEYGGPGGVPVTGDWNGDGTTTVGIVTTATGEWLLNDFNRSGAPTVAPFQFGTPFHQFLAGDWNGDGVWTPAAVRSGTWTPGVLRSGSRWYLKDSLSSGAASVGLKKQTPGTPVVGDWHNRP
jgi:hypothetical protein